MTDKLPVTKKRKSTKDNAIGRPGVDISPDRVLNAWEEYKNINRAARELGISPGVCYNRLKKLGICPLGMIRSERGRFGYMVKAGIFKPVPGQEPRVVLQKVNSTPNA